MFLAMNRFKIVKGCEEDFEKIWRERDTHLQGVEGFKEFNTDQSKTPLSKNQLEDLMERYPD